MRQVAAKTFKSATEAAENLLFRALIRYTDVPQKHAAFGKICSRV